MSNNPHGRTASTSDARKRLAEQQAAAVVVLDLSPNLPAPAAISASGHMWPCPRFYKTEDREPCNCAGVAAGA